MKSKPFSSEALNIVKYCAEEVERQQAGPMAVYWMVEAWEYALLAKRQAQPMSLALIEHFGQLIEPVKNAKGFRRVRVWIGNKICPEPYEVPHLMKAFMTNFEDMSPTEAYLDFERCHPFVDGNGRCGKILLCWKAEKLNDPESVEVPNPWGISNP